MRQTLETLNSDERSVIERYVRKYKINTTVWVTSDDCGVFCYDNMHTFDGACKYGHSEEDRPVDDIKKEIYAAIEKERNLHSNGWRKLYRDITGCYYRTGKDRLVKFMFIVDAIGIIILLILYITKVI